MIVALPGLSLSFFCRAQIGKIVPIKNLTESLIDLKFGRKHLGDL